MNRLKKAFLYLLTYPLFILSHHYPKDRHLLIFGSWRGVKYNDNSKYLFEYVNNNCHYLKALWLSSSPKTVQEIRSLGYDACLMYSVRGVWSTVRAGFAFLSRSKREDLPIFLSPRKTRIIQLWHGTPLKKLGRDSLANYQAEQGIWAQVIRSVRAALFPHSYNKCYAFISSSENVSTLIESAYGDLIGPGGIPVTGYPRNDALFCGGMADQTGIKRGIYMPTFRDNQRDASSLFLDYGFDFDRVESFLSSQGVVLHIKLHPESRLARNDKERFSRSKWLSLIDVDDIYTVLGSYDFLITDYSSIFFDYLLLDRPIIFVPFDLEDYLSARGLYFDYMEITPGIKATNWDDVLIAIRSAVETPDKEASERRRVNEVVNKFRDNHNCRRVIEFTLNQVV